MHYNLRKRVYDRITPVKISINQPIREQNSDRNKKNSLLNNKPQNSNNKMPNLTASLDVILKALPNFDNENNLNIKAFVEQFDALLKKADTTDEVRIILLRSKFSGTAREAILNNPELNHEKDYEKFKAELIKFFEKPKLLAQSQAKFMDIQQKPDQSIDQFVRSFNVTANKYFTDSGHANNEGAKQFLNTMKLTKFINSVRPEIAYQLTIVEPKTFEEAVEIARKVEIALKNSKESINNISAQNSQQNSEDSNTKNHDVLYETLLHRANNQEEEMKKLRESLNNLNVNKQNNSNIENKVNKYCHICKTPTHNTDNCWYNARTMGVFKPQTYRQPLPHNNNIQSDMYNQIQPNYMQIQQPPMQHQPLMPNYANMSQPQNFNTPNNSQNQVPYQNFRGVTRNGPRPQINNSNQRYNTPSYQNRTRTNFPNGRSRGNRNRTFTGRNHSNQPRITFPQGN